MYNVNTVQPLVVVVYNSVVFDCSVRLSARHSLNEMLTNNSITSLATMWDYVMVVNMVSEVKYCMYT